MITGMHSESAVHGFLSDDGAAQGGLNEYRHVHQRTSVCDNSFDLGDNIADR